MSDNVTSILIIYTGGTIGMINDPVTDALTAFDFSQIELKVPELQKFGYSFETITFEPPIDSSNMNPDKWIDLAKIIIENQNKFDGFVVLHGTDTMSYTASALSFVLEKLHKPVIFTGSQIPIGTLRTDGKENLITAIEIAAAKQNNRPIVPEVCIYFENKLYRGNRTTKHNSEYFNAFGSYNYPALADVGIYIKYNYAAIYNPLQTIERSGLKITPRLCFDNNVAIIKFFPGMNNNSVKAILKTIGLKAIIIETYGAGNLPTDKDLIKIIKDAIKQGIIIINVTQCNAGSVDMQKYNTGIELLKAGVINGNDITTEAAITKLMFLLGQNLNNKEIIENIKIPIAGEMTINSRLFS